MLTLVRYAMIGLFCSHFSGCGIGKTDTLFLTRSNAGFEASAQPPTLELAVARQEGTVGPQFEGGKQLPVMSSFRFQNEGFFSPNVGSTFTTGDAAKTMTALYGEPTPYPDWTTRANDVKSDSFPGNSAVVLDEEPEPGRILGLFFMPKHKYQTNNVKPVYFGTDTSVGVKIAWTGLSGQIPDSAKFGYNRRELALAPITRREVNVTDPNTKLTDIKHEMKMASLMATVDTGVKDKELRRANPALDYSHLQYFATGEAATLLALQQDVRRAMHARMDPGREQYTQQFAGEATIKNFAINASILAFLEQGLSELQNAGDSRAGEHVAKLEAVSGLVKSKFGNRSFQKVTFNELNNPPDVVVESYSYPPNPPGSSNLQELTSLISIVGNCHKESEELNAYLIANQDTANWYSDPSSRVLMAPNEIANFKQKLPEYIDMIEELTLELSAILGSYPEIIDAYDYFESRMLISKESKK
ncbi:MAG: hypothetical protein SFY68_13355 [Candidatus Sumerlaeia bacterium]|nr:hypothetical protein [Candidatus Sumerlaeia bacterium]